MSQQNALTDEEEQEVLDRWNQLLSGISESVEVAFARHKGWSRYSQGVDGEMWVHEESKMTMIWSVAPEEDGKLWLHGSVAHPRYTPSYDQVRMMYDIVFVTLPAYMCFVPPEQHVNIHEHALHLFGRISGEPALPDFTRGGSTI